MLFSLSAKLSIENNILDNNLHESRNFHHSADQQKEGMWLPSISGKYFHEEIDYDMLRYGYEIDISDSIHYSYHNCCDRFRNKYFPDIDGSHISFFLLISIMMKMSRFMKIIIQSIILNKEFC